MVPTLRGRYVAAGFIAVLALSACGGGGGRSSPGSALPNASMQKNSAVARSNARLMKDAGLRVDAAIHSGLHALSAVGSSNTTTADPPIPRPPETPCVVTLYSNDTFVDFSFHGFNYAPPSACPGPWKKVVLSADFAVTAGRQFDRTAAIWIGGSNVYFGTTAEPSSNVAPSWHVERDLTDMAPLFEAASQGQVILGNIVDSTYTGVLSGSAQLLFYPRNGTGDEPANGIADAVYPLSAGPLGDVVNLSSPSQLMSTSLQFPRNVLRAYLDVFLQSQATDEFWYTCFPSDLAAKLNNCANTAFREGEVTIDGHIAGVAPIYPWIYTGGIDPYLWRPIPGVDTLNFKPYRVDLTPFAGVLDDGQTHTVAVSVFNTEDHFAATANLLVFEDHQAATLAGGIIQNGTAAMPAETVTDTVAFDSSGNARGKILTGANHEVSVSGYVDTPHGRVVSSVIQHIHFQNDQSVLATSTQFEQNIKQDTRIKAESSRSGEGSRTFLLNSADWPLNLDYNYVVNADGSSYQTTTVDQEKNDELAGILAGGKPYERLLSNVVHSSDTLTFAADGSLTGATPKSQQTYKLFGPHECWNKTVKAANLIVTSVSGGSC